MKYLILLFSFISATSLNLNAQQNTADFKVTVSLDSRLSKDFTPEGRMYLFISEGSYVEPRMNTWPSPFEKTYVFAKNIVIQDKNWTVEISNKQAYQGTPEWGLAAVPKGKYYIQVLWDQDISESRTDAPGNLYSEPMSVTLDKSMSIELELSEKIKERELIAHPLCKYVEIESDLLTKFWGKSMKIKASVLLPHNYNKENNYAVRYNVSGYGGRYTRVNNLLSDDQFMSWWDSEAAPQIITVYLDGEGPFGDSYQMDSENSGPYGESLVTEVIPYIEDMYRGDSSAEMRFVDGCSTGGWVSLGLQLYYPEVFNGCFSYSPDAIDFRHYQLINIYKDKNAFTNEFGYDRPVMRDYTGEPMLSLKEFIGHENVLGNSGTYVNSGGQFSAHMALYGPKGADGLPMPLFDPETGVIDSKVAEHWKKYDFKIHLEKNWKNLVPKLQGKIYMWMGDMDHFFLSSAARHFAVFVEDHSSPELDAQLDFTPMEGHCSRYSDRLVLEQIQARIELLQKTK
ncbi:MAG: alpha/beta hydrolase-fold protein [Flavobacteriales bacterium]